MERRQRRFQSPLGFFGLSPKYKLKLHEQIFQIIFYAKGGFTFSEIYDLPVYLRQFYYQELLDTRKKENQEAKKAQRKNKPQVSRPPTNPRFKR